MAEVPPMELPVTPPNEPPKPPSEQADPKHEDHTPKDKPHVVGEKPQPLKAPKSEYDSIYEYPDKMELAAKTGHALDRSLMSISKLYLGKGEERRQSLWRASIPLFGGMGVGLSHFSSMAEQVGVGALVGVFSPVVSMVRRVTGENAFTQFARFANRREDTGFIGRILRGGESRVLKHLFLEEDKDTRQLLRLFDQQVDESMLNSLNLGSKDRIDNLVAAGYMAEMKAQMVAELDIKLSKKEMDKLKRMHDAYEMSKRVYENKIPTLGQKQRFVNDVLPNLLANKERALWGKQTLGLAGIGAAKTAGAALMGYMFGSGLVGSAVTGVVDATGKIIGGAISSLPTGAGIQSWINANITGMAPSPPLVPLPPRHVFGAGGPNPRPFTSP